MEKGPYSCIHSHSLFLPLPFQAVMSDGSVYETMCAAGRQTGSETQASNRLPCPVFSLVLLAAVRLSLNQTPDSPL